MESSHETTSMRRFLNCLMLMAAERLPNQTSTSLQSKWGGRPDKVSTSNSFSYNFLRLVEELIFELDPNHNGEITEDEFNVICKHISSRGSASFPPIEGKSSTSRSGLKQNATATIHMYE